MVTDFFIIILQDKCTVFTRTESGRIFDVTDCQPIIDNKFGINYNGVLSTSKLVTSEYVADSLTKGASIVFKKRKKTKRRAVAKAKRNSSCTERHYHHVISTHQEDEAG